MNTLKSINGVCGSMRTGMGGWTSICLLAVLGVSVTPAHAQTVTVEVNKPFKVAASHDGVTTTQYLLTVDRPGTLANHVATLPVTALSAGEVVFDVPAQATVGAYTAQVCARNVDPADPTNFAQTCSDALAFSVAKPIMPPPPLKPGIRIMADLIAMGMTIPVTLVVTNVEDPTPVLRVR
jgi:hypothetical protein